MADQIKLKYYQFSIKNLNDHRIDAQILETNREHLKTFYPGTNIVAKMMKDASFEWLIMTGWIEGKETWVGGMLFKNVLTDDGI